MIAAKISKNKKFDVDNANVEIKILKKLGSHLEEDDEGRHWQTARGSRSFFLISKFKICEVFEASRLSLNGFIGVP